MTEEDKNNFELYLEAHRSYSMQKPSIEEVERRPAKAGATAGWDWQNANPNTIESPADFRFGPSEVKQPSEQQNPKRSPGK